MVTWSERWILRLLVTLMVFAVAGLIIFSINLTPPTKDHKILSISIHSKDGLPPRQRNYTILIWRHGKRMLRRFLRSYGTIERDPFLHCSVRNCHVRIDDIKGLPHSDAVMIHLHQTRSPKDLPPFRLQHQQWIFFTDESPLHTFMLNPRSRMSDYNGIFNWSMTYRADSDVPVPYGRTVVRKNVTKDTTNYSRLNVKFAAILGSNCGGKNHRWDYVKELQKHVPVDIYGGCGPLKCPGHFTRDCLPLKNYKFYLAFENSNCKEYMTEKLWWNAYAKNSVPVVMGPSRADYERLCPPGSFIHVEDFASPIELSKFLQYLASNETSYNQYFQWKDKYEVQNEHGYFGTPTMHLCRICEALNSNRKPKSYDKLETFWNKNSDCLNPKWSPS